MTDKEAMQQALDALEAALSDDKPYISRSAEAIEALRTALAKPEPEPEPVAWMYDWTTSDGEFIQDWTTSEAETLRDTKPNIISNIRPLYTAQREWVGLTDEEVVNRANAEVFAEAFARGVAWAELKLKEKNT